MFSETRLRRRIFRLTLAPAPATRTLATISIPVALPQTEEESHIERLRNRALAADTDRAVDCPGSIIRPLSCFPESGATPDARREVLVAGCAAPLRPHRYRIFPDRRANWSAASSDRAFRVPRCGDPPGAWSLRGEPGEAAKQLFER